MADERQTFLVLADAGSFAQAARQLGVSRSTVMRRVDALEARLRLTLVQRAGQRVALTEAGQRYAAHLRPALAALDRAEQEVQAASGGLTGTLRLLLPILGTGAYIAPAVAGFRAAHPDVVVHLDMVDDLRGLRVGDFDVAMQFGLRRNPSLRVRSTFKERLILVASAAYVAAHGRPGGVAALADHHAIVQRTPDGRPAPWRWPDGRRIAAPPTAISVNSIGFAFDLVRAGAGIGRVPRMLAAPLLADRTLVHVLPEVWTEDRVSFVFPPDPTPAARAFLDFMSARHAQAEAHPTPPHGAAP
jgi:DNA-binding transcriptional LysR family regulator